MNINAISKGRPYVSFDIFDTLIKRSVAKPSDLFLLMEEYLSRSRPEIPANFAKKRQESEWLAGQEIGRPVSIGEIYEKLSGEFGEYANELMMLEIEMEIKGCQPNPKTVEWLSQCVAAGKTVILISDMYLSAAVLRKILDKCGITGYTKIYVSCECGARKRDGSLFRYVCNDLRISPKQLVHIGDNRRGDVWTPTWMGIQAVWLRNDEKKVCKLPSDVAPKDALLYRTLRACMRNCSRDMSEYEKMGCRIFGPQLYGFTVWLAERLNQDGIHDAYFLARDGYMLQRAFDELGIEGIKTHYLYCSRRAFQLPLLRNAKQLEDTAYLFWYRKKLTLRRFLIQLGLDPDSYKDHAAEFGLDIDRIYLREDFLQSEDVKNFYSSIQTVVTMNAQKEYNALIRYLKSFDMPDKIAVVDIGFYGTIQNSLDKLLDEMSLQTTTYGYYFHMSNKTHEVYQIEAWGYHLGDKPLSLLFEAQFLAQLGSLKRFVLEEGEVRPEFEKFEYKDDDSKLIDEVAFFERYQSGAIEFVRYMKDAFPIGSFTPDFDTAMYDMTRLTQKPSLKEATFWGKIRYINFTTGYLANPKSIFYYLLHPKKLLSDIYACGWRAGFLRRLLKLPVEYEKIISFLKRLVKQ